MMTDPIADMLTRIRNAIQVQKIEVAVPASEIKLAIAKILKNEGYISEVERKTGRSGTASELKITLGYGPQNDSPIHEIKRISKPGRRIFAGYRQLPRVAGDAGIAIISTPKGIMTNKEARKIKLGGEVICEVY